MGETVTISSPFTRAPETSLSGQRILTISPSSLNEAMICMRKFNFAVLQRLRPAFGQSSVALESGDMVHRILEQHYTQIKDGVPYHEVVQNGIEYGRSLCVKYNLPPEDIEAIIRTYNQYSDFWKNDVFVPVFVEQPFSVVLFESPELKILFEGKIDLIMKNLMTKKLTLFDHKSESRYSEPELLSNQFLGYMWALKFSEIVVNKVGLQKTVPLVKRFRRIPLLATPQLLNQWTTWAIFWTVLIDKYAQEGIFPPTYSSCWKCRYTEICESPEESWEAKLKMMFRPSSRHDLFAMKPAAEIEVEEKTDVPSEG